MKTQMVTSKDGGELISFKINGIEKIHQGSDCVDENGKVYWKRHFPILFPIVGKLKRNQTIINGKSYEIFQHGFARDMEYTPVTKLDNFHSYVLKSNKATLARYPFDFELYNTYRMEEDTITTIYKVINTGSINMPFCIGGHPALVIDPNEMNKGNYYLEFEEDEEKIHFLYLVDGLIGTEYAKNRMEDKRHMMLGPDSFKNDAIIMKGITSKRISLMHRYKEKPVFTVEFSDFPYLGIWSKPNAPFLCIEPWHGFSDSIKSSGIFAEKTGSILLKPGQSYECRYSIKFYED